MSTFYCLTNNVVYAIICQIISGVQKMSNNQIEKENFLTRLLKKIENFAALIFKRQIDESKELPAYTEEDFDKDLEKALQKDEKYPEEAEFIMMIEKECTNSDLINHITKGIEDKTYSTQYADKKGNTLLHAAVQKKGLENLVLTLIKNGADVNKMNKNLQTPINLAYSAHMRQGLYTFSKKQIHHSYQVKKYISDAIKNQSIIPIDEKDLETKFPTPIITITDLIKKTFKITEEDLKAIDPMIENDKITRLSQNNDTQDKGIDFLFGKDATVLQPTQITHQNTQVKKGDMGHPPRES